MNDKYRLNSNTMQINNMTYVDYISRLRLVATSLFTWEGLDEIGGNSRFLEQVLYEDGRACFVKDETKGYMTLRANPCDKYNVYMLPIQIEAWSVGYNRKYKFDDIVYIMNNEMQLPTRNTLEIIAYRLYETERTIDTNLIAQKTPVLIEGDTKTILTLKNVYMQYSGNTPFIFGNKQFDISNKLNVLKTDAPYLIDKLEIHKHDLWNEALTYLGINNANTDKKERLITNEVDSNNELINLNLQSLMIPRKEACRQFNEKYGLMGEKAIDVKIRSDLYNLVKEFESVTRDYQEEKRTEETIEEGVGGGIDG